MTDDDPHPETLDLDEPDTRCNVPCRVDVLATPMQITHSCVRPKGHEGWCNEKGDWDPREELKGGRRFVAVDDGAN